MNRKINELNDKHEYTFDDLQDIMKILRSPEGCPWDREQDHKSIRKNFIEETYEVCEAIDTDNPVLLCEELGDVMMQVVFHTEMEREAGRFEMSDVINGVCKKLIHRHPHVFGNANADTPEKVLANWDAIKKEEKGQKSIGDVLSSVPVTLPALMKAQKMIKKAAKSGEAICENGAEFDGFSSDEYAEILMKICESAVRRGVDLEEILDKKCNDTVNIYKKS